MGDFAIVDPETVPAEPFPESGLDHRKLTERLGCREMRVNAISLEPGDRTSPHAHESQEEAYVSLDGGLVEIDGQPHEVPAGGVVRIGPTVVRSVRNETDGTSQRWLMVGAPPTGTIEDFGEYRMPD